MIEAGLWNSELESLELKKGNQAIISGTADYAFKHFAKYWNRYKTIINSKGDRTALEELFKGEVPENFDWRDYSIIRIPYELKIFFFKFHLQLIPTKMLFVDVGYLA